MEFCSAQSLRQFYARGARLLEPCLLALAYELLFAIFGKGYLACLAKSIANYSSHEWIRLFKCSRNAETMALL